MKKDSKLEFVADLIGHVTQEILSKIAKDEVPEDWDGIELRQYIADKFAHETTNMERTRKRDYQNEVLVRNL